MRVYVLCYEDDEYGRNEFIGLFSNLKELLEYCKLHEYDVRPYDEFCSFDYGYNYFSETLNLE